MYWSPSIDSETGARFCNRNKGVNRKNSCSRCEKWLYKSWGFLIRVSSLVTGRATNVDLDFVVSKPSDWEVGWDLINTISSSIDPRLPFHIFLFLRPVLKEVEISIIK